MAMPLEITGYVCPSCGWADLHPAHLCPRCIGPVRRSTFKGKGRVVTFTAIRYPPSGFEDRAPYVVAIIDLENGSRVIGRVSDAVDQVKIGSMVSLASAEEDGLEFRLAA